jgi:hypothetical protein
MDYLGRFISFLGVLALFGPSAVLAQQGTITGINVEPTPGACSLEKITVTGTGRCSSWARKTCPTEEGRFFDRAIGRQL